MSHAGSQAAPSWTPHWRRPRTFSRPTRLPGAPCCARLPAAFPSSSFFMLSLSSTTVASWLSTWPSSSCVCFRSARHRSASDCSSSARLLASTCSARHACSHAEQLRRQLGVIGEGPAVRDNTVMPHLGASDRVRQLGLTRLRVCLRLPLGRLLVLGPAPQLFRLRALLLRPLLHFADLARALPQLKGTAAAELVSPRSAPGVEYWGVFGSHSYLLGHVVGGRLQLTQLEGVLHAKRSVIW